MSGRDDYEADQRVGEQVAGMFPVIREVARADRDFLGRAVAHLTAERGVRQFLDIGTGLPTVDNTHEIASERTRSRWGYPPGGGPHPSRGSYTSTTTLERAAQTLDLTRPAVAVMMPGILNFVLDTEKARDIVRRLRAAVPSGSFLVLTRPTHDDELGGAGQVPAMEFWNENATPPIRARSGADIAAFFQGLRLLEPGLVSCSRWHAEAGAAPVPQYGAVAVKP